MEPKPVSKFLALFKSRKFWSALIAVISAVAAFALNEISVWQLVQAVVAVAAAYSTGVAIEDAGWHIGQ